MTRRSEGRGRWRWSRSTAARRALSSQQRWSATTKRRSARSFQAGPALRAAPATRSGRCIPPARRALARGAARVLGRHLEGVFPLVVTDDVIAAVAARAVRRRRPGCHVAARLTHFRFERRIAEEVVLGAYEVHASGSRRPPTTDRRQVRCHRTAARGLHGRRVRPEQAADH